MNRVFLLVGLVLAALAVAFAGHFPSAFHSGAYAFHGHYGGHCGNDGFYYKDHYSFVICSNGNAYEQPCAPGSRNSAYGRYSHGHNYHYRDFCDVNLVDYGYGAHRPAYGHNNHGHSLGGNAHGAHAHGGRAHAGFGHGGGFAHGGHGGHGGHGHFGFAPFHGRRYY